jgi:hypothetical protein
MCFSHSQFFNELAEEAGMRIARYLWNRVNTAGQLKAGWGTTAVSRLFGPVASKEERDLVAGPFVATSPVSDVSAPNCELARDDRQLLNGAASPPLASDSGANSKSSESGGRDSP